MLPTVWVKSLERNKWSSKDFNEEITEGAIIVSILVGGRKNPPHIENQVSRGWQFSTTSLELCG
jgi:hypothetical protein